MRRAEELCSKQTKWTPYVKGQKVWLEGTHLSTSHTFTKLCPKQFGPFQITETLGPEIYRLDLPENWRIHNAFHATLLSSYVETEEHRVNFTELPPDLIEGEPEWEVKKVLELRHHGRKKQLQYLIKWREYNIAHNSWEPAEHVHAPELLKEFYYEQPIAIKAAKTWEESQCLSDSPSLTLSPKSPSDTSTSASPTKFPLNTLHQKKKTYLIHTYSFLFLTYPQNKRNKLS